MKPENMARLLAAMREAVVAGRAMRSRQAFYFKTKRQPDLLVALQHEKVFDDLSLTAVRLEQQINSEEGNEAHDDT